MIQHGNRLDRRPALRVAGHGHDSGERLHDRVVAGPVVSQRPGSEGADRTVHDLGTDAAQVFEAQTQPLGDPGAERLDHHVGAPAAGLLPNDLGQVVGAVVTDDLLDRIFRRFCIGK